MTTTLLTRNWVAPGLNDGDPPSPDVVAGVLGGMALSRLNTALVRDEKLAVRVDATYEPYAQLGLFTIEVNVRPGDDTVNVERRLDQIVGSFLQVGPTADEFDRFATGQITRQIGELGSVGDQAATLAEGEFYSNDPVFPRSG